jgi:hypothetical protein
LILSLIFNGPQGMAYLFTGLAVVRVQYGQLVTVSLIVELSE